MAQHPDPFHHIRDSLVFEVPQFLGGTWKIPQPFGESFHITKYMILEVVAALIVFLIYRNLAAKIQSGEPIRGRFWNFWEPLAIAIRDNVVRPTIGTGHHGHDAHDEHAHGAQHAHSAHGDHAAQAHSTGGHAAHADAAPAASAVAVVHAHPADRYLPFVWSIFFFVLVCNLLGAVPFLGSPTASVWVTGVLAASTLFYVILCGSMELGGVDFWVALVPKLDLPLVLKVPLWLMLWVIEFFGLLVKHGVLAVRLFANIMAGHTVIAVMLMFIGQVAGSSLLYVVAPASVLGQVGIGLLELFVAFLQAYIFAFLATLFIGTAVHPH